MFKNYITRQLEFDFNFSYSSNEDSLSITEIRNILENMTSTNVRCWSETPVSYYDNDRTYIYRIASS